ncbi:hypothetical protein [Sphingomonas aerophila]|uniref:Uncharacterized protein n=1 Tax=Sphingomonas aerophila TaxID=1344948 RepID=A0A7W9BBQ7_9SPHN|nr:hypothetical protein [Sphingomonas aerophila]MBB5714258.1 hypothetical protein [Sphingomonas aerophila]
MIALLLLAAAADDPALARAQARLAPEQPCSLNPSDPDVVTVCARRRADRFRVPYLTVTPGDPRHEAVLVERDRLLLRTNPVQELSPFLVGGGMAGATVKAGAGGVHAETLRPLAP